MPGVIILIFFVKKVFFFLVDLSIAFYEFRYREQKYASRLSTWWKGGGKKKEGLLSACNHRAHFNNTIRVYSFGDFRIRRHGRREEGKKRRRKKNAQNPPSSRMTMKNGNQRLFTDDCIADNSVKVNFPQNTISLVTSPVSGLQHTITDSTPPKITSSLNKVRI